jgi:hypothetical protein
MIERAQHAGTEIMSQDKSEINIDHDAGDIELHKPGPEVELGEEGAFRTELMQQVWGKHGKLFVFLGLVERFLSQQIRRLTLLCYLAWHSV